MTRIRLVIALLVVGLVAVPVASAKAPKTVKVSRGATTLALDSDTAAALTSLGLTVSPLKPAKATKAGIAFPVTNGRLNAKTYAGRISHTGGLRIASDMTKVD